MTLHFDMHDVEAENASLTRELNELKIQVMALEVQTRNAERNACRCAATETVVAEWATRHRARRYTSSPVRVVIRGGAGTRDDLHRLVEIRDRTPDWAASLVEETSDEGMDESGAAGPAPREDSPEA